jgi:small subunit ribosomal protein S9
MTKPLTQTTGRRKEAVARVRVRPGTGTHTVNGKPLNVYFCTATQQNAAVEALRVTNTTEQYDVDATIQSGAMRMGLARSLVELDPDARGALKKAGLLTRDSRRKESKKYGLRKARKAGQYTKR